MLKLPVLRGIARNAGVHLYSEKGDVLYATPDLLAVHTVSGGCRTFSLPRQVEVVYDLYNQRLLQRELQQDNPFAGIGIAAPRREVDAQLLVRLVP